MEGTADPYFETFPRWIDNKVEGKRFIDNVLHCLKSCPETTWCTGYFYISGMLALKASLDHVNEIRIIIGLGTDDLTASTIERSVENVKKMVVDEVNKDINAIDFNEYGNYFDYIYDCLVSGKIKIRVIGKPSHKKIYWFDQFDKVHDVVMHGSANFSLSGLGIAYQDNNLQIDSTKTSPGVVTHYKHEIEDDWVTSVPFTRDLVDVIDRHPDVRKHRGKGGGGTGGKTEDPEGLVYLDPPSFFKYIIHEHKMFHLFDTGKFTLRSFQLVDYLLCKECIENTGGVILSDEAGLGKTIISCRILQDYYQQGKRFLIIVPPGTTMDQWMEHVRNFGIGFEHGSKIISEGIIPHDTFSEKDWSGFDFVLIDESHHFRNMNTARFGNFMSHVKAVNPNANVMLVTATPINNTVVDLVNQVRMIENVGKFRTTVGMDFDQFKIIARKRSLDEVDNARLGSIAERLQKKLIVRTTSRDLRESGETFEILGVEANFQEIIPEQATYTFTGEVYAEIFEKLFPDFIDLLLLPHVGFFSSIISMDDEDDDGGFSYGFQITQLYKRFESSIHAFRVSLYNLKRREGKLAMLLTDPTIDKKVDQLRIYDARIRSMGWMTDDKSIERKKEVVQRYKELRKRVQESWNDSKALDSRSITSILHEVDAERCIGKVLVKNIIIDLLQDIRAIENFEMLLGKLHKSPIPHDIMDDKIDLLVSRIDSFDNNDKILIFTQFTTTARYIKQRLENSGIRSVELVHGQMPKHEKDDRVVRFCPDYAPKKIVDAVKERNGGSLPPEIRILVATDTMSQSVNLQEARYVINYDLPWNPMIMYQRNGRARRINNPNPVDIINFIPEPNIDESIQLIEKLEKKIADIASVIGLSSKILSKNDKYTLSSKEIKEAFTAKMERIRTMGVEDQEVASIEERPMSELMKRLIDACGWTMQDVKNQGTREKIPYTILKHPIDEGVLFFYSVVRKGKGADIFKRDSIFIGVDESTALDQSNVPVPLVAGRRPLHGDELSTLQTIDETVMPNTMKEIQSSVHRSKQSIKADVKANREKNKMITMIKRSPIYHQAIGESSEDKKIKANVKKITRSIAKKNLVTNDALPEITSFINTWLKERKNIAGETLKEMLVDLETIDAITSSAEEMVSGRELAGKVDGYIVVRKQ